MGPEDLDMPCDLAHGSDEKRARSSNLYGNGYQMKIHVPSKKNMKNHDLEKKLITYNFSQSDRETNALREAFSRYRQWKLLAFS